ncbi:MAG: contractile injection system protein, VgrG/Pvc8 family [Vicinamibacterales bacterium]
MPSPGASTSAPRPAIYVDGVEQPGLTADLEELVIEEALSQPARCRGRFANVAPTRAGVEFTYFGLQAVTFGRSLTVWQGVPPATLVRMFEGRVDDVGGAYPEAAPPGFVVGAGDGLAAFRERQRTRTFEDVSDSEMIQTIAGEHGLALDLDLAGPQPTHAVTVQLNQSDAAFLADRLAALDAAMWIEAGTLVVRASASAPVQTLQYGRELTAFDVSASLQGQRSAIGVTGWDVRAKQAFVATAVDADLTAASGTTATGPRIRELAFGPAIEAAVDELPATAEEAHGLAVAHLRARAARFITGRGQAIGAVALRAGHAVDVQGLGTLFSGTYQVTAVRHEFTRDRGWRTTFDIRRQALGPVGKSRPSEENVHARAGSRHDTAHRDRRRGASARRRTPARRPT